MIPKKKPEWIGIVYGDLIDSDQEKPVIDMPPPPAAIQPANISSWERQLKPSASTAAPFDGWQAGMTSPWDSEALPDINIDTTVPLVQVAALAFNAGWEGEDLVEAVAIQIAEERNQNRFAVGDFGIQDKDFGPSFGLWQIRSLKQPWQKGQPAADRLRTFEATGNGADLFDLQTNANVAYQLWKEAGGWQPWTVSHESARGTENDYRNFIPQAREAVAQLNQILG